MSVSQALENFQQRYFEQYQQQHNSLPVIEQDADWPSTCEQGVVDAEGNIHWQPARCGEGLDFTAMEQALEMELHPDIKAYFTSFYSDNLSAQCAEGGLELLLPWNRQDFDRLQENLIGHILMKRKRKQPATVFFAVTDDD